MEHHPRSWWVAQECLPECTNCHSNDSNPPLSETFKPYLLFWDFKVYCLAIADKFEAEGVVIPHHTEINGIELIDLYDNVRQACKKLRGY